MNKAVGILLILGFVALGFSAHAIKPEQLSVAEAEDTRMYQAEPSGPVLLNLHGEVTETLQFDHRRLTALGLWRYTVTDPWDQQRVAYSGVLLSDMLDRAGASVDASVLVIASDGYRFRIPHEAYRGMPVLLAMQRNGSDIDDDKGPLRIIFPYDDYPDLEGAKNMSVWAVVEIIVE